MEKNNSNIYPFIVPEAIEAFPTIIGKLFKKIFDYQVKTLKKTMMSMGISNNDFLNKFNSIHGVFTIVRKKNLSTIYELKIGNHSELDVYAAIAENDAEIICRNEMNFFDGSLLFDDHIFSLHTNLSTDFDISCMIALAAMLTSEKRLFLKKVCKEIFDKE